MPVGNQTSTIPCSPEAIPTIEIPFQQIAMEVTGPLPMTRAGNHFILVVMDFSTRWPEAFVLMKMDSTKVILMLLEMFIWTRKPQEVVTDCGRNFISKMTKEFY